MHHAADQVTYVIDGEVGIRVGDDIFNAPADAYVIKPRARLIGLAAPSGLLSARGGEVDRAFEMLVRPR